MQYTRERMQVAADAAALAAALELDRASGKQLQAAIEDAARNGFTHGSNGVTLSVQTPPTTASYQGKPSATEVVVSQSLRPLIVSAFGVGSVDLRVHAIAYATVEGAALAK